MSNKNVIIIDYDMGNLYSVNQACHRVGINSEISTDKMKIDNADAIILPGVGAYADAMQKLNELNIAQSIIDFASSGRPFLGICLGMQLMMTYSEEFGINKGLNIIPGKVLKFPIETNSSSNFKIPQIQWNKIRINKNKSIFNGIMDLEYMYFLHSYYVMPEDQEVIASATEYCGIEYCSAIQKNNIMAVQFHPEKSTKQGLQILDNFKNSI
jgi:glutamine amidotransferase